MENQADVRRVSIRNLLLAVAGRWKLLLAVTLALAMMAGGIRGVTGLRRAGDGARRERETAAYETARENYESRKKELEGEISGLEMGIANQLDYLEQSALMNIDPYNVYEGVMYLYISTGYQIMPEMTYQNTDETRTVTLLYQAALVSSGVLEPVADKLGIDSKYLRELVTVEADRSGSPVLTATALGSTREQVETILEALNTSLAAVQTEITAAVGAHRVETALQSVRCHADQSLVDQQKNASDRVEKLTLSLDEARGQLSSLEAPAAPAYTRSSIGKAAVKFAVLFGLLGFAGVAFCICVKFLVGDRVYSGAEIWYRCNVKVLGSVSLTVKKRNPLDAAIRRMEGRGQAGDCRAVSLLAAKIENAVEPGTSVLLTGQAGEEVLHAVAALLRTELTGVQVVAEGCLLRDAAAVRSLRDCKAVLLVEQCGCSRYSGISRQAAYVNDENRQLLGCIAVDN